MTIAMMLPAGMRTAALVACLAVSACRFGTTPKDIDWVNSPEGARIALRVNGEARDRVGELLSVDEEVVVLRSYEAVEGVELRSPKLVRVSWSRVYAIDVDRLGGAYDVLRGQLVTPGERQKLSLISRFPQGISPEILAKLLTSTKQTAVEEVR